MILKVCSRKQGSFRQLLFYMLQQEEVVPDSRVMLHNLRGQDVDTWVQEFETNESYRKRKRKNSTILTHEILSWHPKDTPYLSVSMIERLTREYISLRNPNGLYVGVIHQAKDHYHVHLCVSGVEYRSGKVMRMSKREMNTIKRKLEAIQQELYPELRHSKVVHGRKKMRMIER